MNLTVVCANIKNYFLRDIYEGTFTISGGSITPLDFLLPNQYFRIVGSILNDGVYQNEAESLSKLQDETFEGAIWSMAVPPDFLALCADIEAWRAKNEATDSENMSPFTSESFGGYSYSKGATSTSSGNGSVTWQDQFRRQLNTYRRIYL